MACGINISVIQLEVPNSPCTPPPSSPKKCGCGCGDKSGAETCSPSGIAYSNGAVFLESSDLETRGFGQPWGHHRSFASFLTGCNLGNGYNWQVGQWSRLNIQNDGDTVVVVGGAHQSLWFDRVGASYVPRFDVAEILVLDADAEAYRLYDLDGTVTEYSSTTGLLIKQTAPGGGTTAVTQYAASGNTPLTVERGYMEGGTTTTEQLNYEYAGEATNLPLLTRVTLRRQVDGGSWSEVCVRSANRIFDFPG